MVSRVGRSSSQFYLLVSRNKSEIKTLVLIIQLTHESFVVFQMFARRITVSELQQMSAQSSYSSRSQQASQMQMSQHEFKDMCRQLKIFPVVVSEETIDKVTLFCAAKRNGG